MEPFAGMVFSEYAGRAGCNHLLAQILRGVYGQPHYDHVGENRLMSAVAWMPLRRGI